MKHEKCSDVSYQPSNEATQLKLARISAVHMHDILHLLSSAVGWRLVATAIFAIFEALSWISIHAISIAHNLFANIANIASLCSI